MSVRLSLIAIARGMCAERATGDGEDVLVRFKAASVDAARFEAEIRRRWPDLGWAESVSATGTYRAYRFTASDMASVER